MPPDFEATFVKLGRLVCQEHYQVGRNTITRWLDQSGKWRLIEARRAFVRQRGVEARIGRTKAEQVHRLETDTLAVLHIPDPAIAAQAADYLRTPRGGGWIVSMAKDGDWIVGLIRRSSAELITKAERHGFDVAAANLRASYGFGVGSAK